MESAAIQQTTQTHHWAKSGKDGTNSPSGEQKQVQGLASACNPVRQMVWQNLKELSPY